MLMQYVKDASPTMCKSFTNPDIINLRLPYTFDVRLLSLNQEAQRFYRTIYPRARLNREWDGRAANSAESAMLAGLAATNFAPWVQITMTPLVLTLQQLALEQPLSADSEAAHSHASPVNPRSRSLLSILDILLAAGADLRALDNAGLSAYDHARIMGVDEITIRKLKPANAYDGRTIQQPRPTHPHRRIASSPATQDDIELCVSASPSRLPVHRAAAIPLRPRSNTEMRTRH